MPQCLQHPHLYAVFADSWGRCQFVSRNPVVTPMTSVIIAFEHFAAVFKFLGDLVH